MAFRVELSPEALGDLDGISSYIETRTRFAVAERWFNGYKNLRVCHVRHWAMKPMETDELEDLMDETADPESESEGHTEER